MILSRQVGKDIYNAYQLISSKVRPGGPIPEQHMSGEEATVCDIRTPQVSENHFRENSLQNKSVTLWQKIIKTTISLPTPHLRRARIIYWY